LSILALGSLFNALMHLPYAVQLAYGWTRFAINMNLISVLLLVPATYWSVSHHGPIAAAVVWMLLNLGYLLVGVPLMHRRLLRGECTRWYRFDIGLPLLTGTLVMGTVYYFVRGTALEYRGVSLGVVLVAGALCTIATILSTPFGIQMLRGVMKSGSFTIPR
jgi:O-antigen/teichoic acid export membrane protein